MDFIEIETPVGHRYRRQYADWDLDPDGQPHKNNPDAERIWHHYAEGYMEWIPVTEPTIIDLLNHIADVTPPPGDPNPKRIMMADEFFQPIADHMNLPVEYIHTATIHLRVGDVAHIDLGLHGSFPPGHDFTQGAEIGHIAITNKEKQ